MRAFAGVIEQDRPAHANDAERVGGVLGEAANTCISGSLALAWTGNDPPTGEPLRFLDGHLYTDGDEFAGLRGDFILIVHDRLRGETTFVRDQLGGRSMVWHHGQGRLTFASEIRYLLPLLPTRPEPDDAGVAHWLSMSMPHDDRTLYAGIHRLMPGHVLRVGRGAPVSRPYWIPRYRRPQPGSRADHVAGLRSVLSDAVERRCPPGESTAVLLSGGLDSSTVAALASRHEPGRRPMGAYSATFPMHPSVDESGLIDILCEQLALRSTRVVVRSGSVLSGAVEYLEHWQIPPPSPNLFFWLPLLRRAAADGVGALLDGEGGDEMFGLSPYLVADRLRHGRLAAAYDLVRRLPGGGPHLDRAALRPFIRRYGVKGATPARLHAAVRRRRGARRYTPEWLLPRYQEAYLATDWLVDWKRLPGPRWWAYLVWTTTRSGPALAYDHVRRRAAMAGIEARHPLVDVDVVEYVLSVPPDVAYDTRHSRPLVREAMAGLLPDEIRLRPSKSNFDAVFHESIAGPDLAVARALLRPDEAELAAYVDLGAVENQLLARVPPPGERTGWGVSLWRLVTAECWLRVHAGRAVDPEWLAARTAPNLEVVAG